MTEEETIKIIIDFIHYIRFNEKPNYTIDYYYKAIEHLYDLYYREKENTKNQDTEINKLNNVIDRMAEYIYSKTDFTTCGNIKSIKEYFMKE